METEPTVERMAELYRGGESIAKVSAATGVGKNRVLKLLREAGVKIRPRHREKPLSERKLEIKPQELARRYRKGESLEHLAGRAGVSSSTVARTLRQMGVKIRPRAGKRVPVLPPREIVERYRAGESAGALAEASGSNVKEIREILLGMGVELRSPLGTGKRHLDHPWFTPEKIVELYEQGETVKALAAAAGVSRGVIQSLLLKQGVGLRGRGGAPSPGPTDLVRNPSEVRRRYEAGESIADIAKAMESTSWRVRTVLLKLGVQIRSRAGARGDDFRPPPMSAEEIAGLYRSGMSIEGIGRKSGLGRSKLERMLREQKVRIRKTAEAVAQPEELRNLTDARIAARYRRGETLEDLADAAGTTVAVIRRVLRDRRVELRPKEVKLQRTPEEIVKLYEEGKSIRDLAASEGCSDDPIRQLLKARGVRIRSPHEMVSKRASKSKLTPAEMEVRYQAGGSLSQIAGAAGIDFKRVAGILRRRGVVLRGRGGRRKEDGEDLKITPEEIESRYRNGGTLVEIAALAGSNRKRVSDILKRRGVSIRTRQDYP